MYQVVVSVRVLLELLVLYTTLQKTGIIDDVQQGYLLIRRNSNHTVLRRRGNDVEMFRWEYRLLEQKISRGFCTKRFDNFPAYIIFHE